MYILSASLLYKAYTWYTHSLYPRRLYLRQLAESYRGIVPKSELN